jgi:hypothetical protein
MASPLVEIQFIVYTKIIGEKNTTESLFVPAVDVLSIRRSTRYEGHSEVVLTGNVNPDTGNPFSMVCPEDPDVLAARVNKAMGFDGVSQPLYAPPVGENLLAGPAADDVEASPV